MSSVNDAEFIEGIKKVIKNEIIRRNLVADVGAGAGAGFNKLAIKHYKVYLLILTALANPKSEKGIFAILLAKYDEVLQECMEMREGLVKENIIEEAYYLSFCKNIKIMRDKAVDMINRWNKQ